MVTSITHFAVCLLGVHFTVETDHRALTFLNSSKLHNSRLARWALQLQSYNFTIRYRSGSHNSNAGALSCLAPADVSSSSGLPSAFYEGGDVVQRSTETVSV